MYRNIMVPIDDSHCSSRALDEAVRLARATGSNLEIIHVIDYGFLRVRAHGGELEEEHQHRVAAGNALLVKARHHAERAAVRGQEQRWRGNLPGQHARACDLAALARGAQVERRRHFRVTTHSSSGSSSSSRQQQQRRPPPPPPPQLLLLL